jgi:hypothetical protein
MKMRTFYESKLNAATQKIEYVTEYGIEYTIEKISLSEDNSFMIYKNNYYPLEYINTVQFGDPKGLGSIVNENKIKLAGRDITKHIIYRTEFRDFIIIFSYDSKMNTYKFDSIKFQNKVYRNI